MGGVPLIDSITRHKKLTLEPESVIDFDAGQKHTCAVRNDSKILCWGTGTNGQLGDGYSINHLTLSL